jgi:hypothetical protein
MIQDLSSPHPHVKNIIISIPSFEKYVRNMLDNYSVSTTTDYEIEKKSIVKLAVNVLVGVDKYDYEFKMLVDRIYNSINTISYKDAVNIANMLINELSGVITCSIGDYNKEYHDYIKCGVLKGNFLVLTII